MFGGGWCTGMGVGGWVFMIGAWATILGLAVWVVTRIFPSDNRSRDAQRSLDRRLASGEIDPQTYSALRDELTGAGRH